MKIEIKIGREVEGNCILIVPSICKKVSRDHAVLIWQDGQVTLVDNESDNGTFVNGMRIAKTSVGEDDTVWLGGENGGEDCYQLDMKKIFDSCREAEKKARTDFSEEFEGVKQVYIEYQNEVKKLRNKQIIRQRLVSFIPMILGGIAAIPDLGLPSWGRPVFLMIGVAATVVMMARESKHDVNEDITELQIKYQDRYCCPKCNQKFPLTTHWKKLAADGKCPKCDAVFVKTVK